MDYSADIAEAIADIEAEGAPIIIRQLVPGELDEVTGFKGADTPVDFPGFGIIEDSSAAFKQFKNSKVLDSDIKLTVPAYPGVVHAIDNHVIIDGVTWSVKTIGFVGPGGVPIIYYLHLT